MAQIRGPSGYNLGAGQHPFGAPANSDDGASNSSPLAAIREQTAKIEDWLDTLSDPVKPYVFCPSSSSQLHIMTSVTCCLDCAGLAGGVV